MSAKGDDADCMYMIEDGEVAIIMRSRVRICRVVLIFILALFIVVGVSISCDFFYKRQVCWFVFQVIKLITEQWKTSRELHKYLQLFLSKLVIVAI